MWCWLGNNAGQIQTIAAVIGLFLAIYALSYSKTQIKHAQSERLFSLRNQLFSESYSTIQTIENTLKQINLIKVQIITPLMNSNKYSIHNELTSTNKSLDETIKNLKDTELELRNFLADFNNEKSILTIELLETLFDKQLSVQEKIFQTQHNINGVELSLSSINK